MKLNYMSKISYLLLFFALMSCTNESTVLGPGVPAASANMIVFTTENFSENAVREAFINAKSGQTIYFHTGVYKMTNTLSLQRVNNVTIKGAGREYTTLSFDGQAGSSGNSGQGILATYADNLVFRDFTITDASKDNIKIEDSNDVRIINVGCVFSGPAEETNGAYGFYPVKCNKVLIEKCYVQGASDAGVYVGQSREVIVRDNEVFQNVAGIEIENCIGSDVYGNDVHHNTGGVLVFDMPGLGVIKNGSKCRVYNNKIYDNNFVNFAPVGNVVGNVPAGTGVMLLAANEVEIFGNQIINNNITGVGIYTWAALEALDPTEKTSDAAYDKFSNKIYIHDNTISHAHTLNPVQRSIGQLMMGLGFNVGLNTGVLKLADVMGGKATPWTADIIWDGIPYVTATGIKDPEIFIKNNITTSAPLAALGRKTAVFANINAMALPDLNAIPSQAALIGALLQHKVDLDAPQHNGTGIVLPAVTDFTK